MPQNDPAQPEPARRLTPSERLHEVTMAALLRQPVKGSETVTFTTPSTGDLKGRLILGAMTCVRGSEESWDDFRARITQQLEDAATLVVAHNAGDTRRELEATLHAAQAGGDGNGENA